MILLEEFFSQDLLGRFCYLWIGIKIENEKKWCKVVYKSVAGDPRRAHVTVKDNEWHVPHYTPKIPQQPLLEEPSFSRAPTHSSFVKVSVSVKDVDKRKS